jgi:hypothetical protein
MHANKRKDLKGTPTTQLMGKLLLNSICIYRQLSKFEPRETNIFPLSIQSRDQSSDPDCKTNEKKPN